jgi:two-component system, response regulator PdtaR
MRVLLVEDEPFIALDLELLVQAEGHEVVGVADAHDEAVSLAQAARPDAALIDVNLRDGLTGPAICRVLTSDYGVRSAFVTGNSEHLPPDRAGALAVVDKPFTPQEIAAVLRRLNGD